ncbi:MAG TPA: DUF3108 domain-containing protein [bacterium]|nr:DUF3108 domain-containing protein [bacterium]
MIASLAAGLLVATATPGLPALPEAPVSGDFGTIPLPEVRPRAGEPDPSRPFGPPESLAPPDPVRPPIPAVLPFAEGEHLRFSLDYGIINAGGATMEVVGSRRMLGRPCFDIRTEARSNGFFSKIYKVWDRAQTFVDKETVLPWRFEKHLREGGYHKDMVIKFDRRSHFARYENGEEVSISPWAQDELSAFYYLRTLPLEVGRDVFIDNHSNRKNYPLKVIVHRRETIEVEAGRFDCWVIEPVIREGGIFTAKGTLTIWLTADERRMPVQMKTKIVVGSITASLQEYRLGSSGAELTARIGG